MNHKNRKKLLFISRHAPYGSSLAKDALDAILAASAYEQDIALLFMDDGIFQLLPAQKAELIEQRSFSAQLQALPLYEIEKIYVHLESMEKRRIVKDDFCLDNIQVLDNAATTQLIAEQDHLLSF
jgi:tRNA 2-thiouridine synthesizing protein C